MYRQESWTYPSQYRLSHEFIQGLTTTDTKILYKLQLEVTQLIAIGYKYLQVPLRPLDTS